MSAIARALVESTDPSVIDAAAARSGTEPEVAAEQLRETALRPLTSNATLRRMLTEEQQRAEIVSDN